MEKELQWLLLPLFSPSYRPLSSLTLGLTYTLLPQDSGDLACWLEKQANFMLGKWLLSAKGSTHWVCYANPCSPSVGPQPAQQEEWPEGRGFGGVGTPGSYPGWPKGKSIDGSETW